MSEAVTSEAEDKYLEELKASRQRPAVLKLRLANLRGQLPNALIFVFEGDDDKFVYFQWIKRIRSELQYEPFPCSGKKNVLELKDIIVRDMGNIGDGVYFFVDRDFDDFAGYSDHPSVFMTDCYSVENYLVSIDVLTELLKNEFHCHVELNVRYRVCELFEKLYSKFLQETKEINRRIFIARRLQIDLGSHIPDKIKSFVVIHLDNVCSSATSPEQIIRYAVEPNPKDLLNESIEFDKLDPPARYRGKFALQFFLKWLDHLADDHSNEQGKLFQGIEKRAKVRREEIRLSALASKSPLPPGLREFILAVTPLV